MFTRVSGILSSTIFILSFAFIYMLDLITFPAHISDGLILLSMRFTVLCLLRVLANRFPLLQVFLPNLTMQLNKLNTEFLN